MNRIALLCLVVWLSVLVGCGSGGGKTPERATVSVTILPLKYLVDSIGGGDFEAVVVVPPGASPETYEPTLLQMKEVARSEAYFQIGLIDFEKPFEAGIRNNSPEMRFVDLSQGLALIEGGHSHDHSHSPDDGHHHGVDPHVWLSPVRMRQMAQKIAETLSEIRPDSAEKYAENRNRIISTIDSVGRYIVRSFSGLKSSGFLIYHPFLSYYAGDYGLRQIPVEREGKEPSAAYLKTLISTISDEGIRTVFYQEGQHRRTVEPLIREAGLQAVVLDPLAYDWAENMKTITDHIKESLDE